MSESDIEELSQQQPLPGEFTDLLTDPAFEKRAEDSAELQQQLERKE